MSNSIALSLHLSYSISLLKKNTFSAGWKLPSVPGPLLAQNLQHWWAPLIRVGCMNSYRWGWRAEKKKRTEPARPNQYTDAMHYISIPNSQIKSKSTLNISQIDAYHCIHSQINIHRSSEKSKSTTPLFFSLGHLASIATTRRPLPWWKKRRLDPAVPKLMLAEFDRPELKGRWIWPLAQPHPPQIDSRERETWRCGSLRVCRDTLSRRRAATL